ncbi:chromodomain protein [Colletotrichum plurivorum]|uniref:Chromodomain protein n=1 Tax=Colletotrichum plurivorum TaxID=2175906 RepID=A0A8H6JX99_9PEZI|nr:chromodomain protein [Colletotrichum plurivorum]
MLSFINAGPRRSRTPETRAAPSPFDKPSKLSNPSLSPDLSARPAMSPERTIELSPFNFQQPIRRCQMRQSLRRSQSSRPQMHRPQRRASSSPPKKDASDSKRYPVHKILDFRRTDDGVDLLVRWGGNWLRDEPTWEPEEVLWNSCRQKVVKFWSPNGWNRRNRLLKLDPVAGPFTVNRILGERKIRKSKGREDGGMAYLVEFLGYERPKWKAGLEAIEERKARRGRKAKS